MKILAIRGQNLASLARTFEVDLVHGPLGGTGLFAITGPVGAGKSTLLDALCLPLFDQTPRLRGRGGPLVGDGDDQDDWLRANDPRSLLRRDAAEGFAEVDFRGRDGRRYRARWSVRRARRRADGRVQEQELSLRDLDRDSVVAAGRRSEVLAAIERLLGLDFDQFCRSVLLAQGEFAAFLKAPANDRARLLETLTGADIYRRLSRAAHERAREAMAELDRVRAQFDAQAPLDVAARAELDGEVARLGSQLAVERVAIQLASQYLAWYARAEQFRQRESAAVVALQQAIAIDTAAEVRRVELQRRQRALAVVAHWELAEQTRLAAVAAHAESERTAAALAAAQAAAAAAVPPWQQAQHAVFGAMPAEPLPPLAQDPLPWLPLLQQVFAAGAAQAEATDRLPSLRRDVAAAQELTEQMQSAVVVAQTAVATARSQLGAAQAAIDLDSATRLLTQREELDARREAARAALRAAEVWSSRQQTTAAAGVAVTTAEAELAARQRGLVTAQQRAAGSRTMVAQRREQLESLRASARAAALREHLHDGAPCPLCGSLAHPAPVVADDAALDIAQRALAAAERGALGLEQELADAGAAVRAAERERQRAELELVAVRAELPAAAAACAAALTAAVGGGAAAPCANPTEAHADAAARLDAANQALAGTARALTELQARQRALQHANLELTTAEAELQRRQQAAHQATERGRRAGEAMAELERELAAASARRADALAALAPAVAGLPFGIDRVLAGGAVAMQQLQALPALRDRILRAEQAVAAAAALHRQAVLGAEAAVRDEKQQAHAFTRALRANEVDADSVAAAAQRGAQGLSAEAHELRELADAVTRCRAELVAIAGERQRHENESRPTLRDAADAEAALADAQRQARQTQEALDQARARCGADDLIRRQRAELGPRLERAEADHATWRALADLIGSSAGDAFAVFAQGLTLELLLTEANRRLGELARRYRLHKNPGGDLDFVVVDLDLGGTRRSLQSLSGGETFLVSLALALALATLAAPKSRVETLFLDEGFGSLDTQALEIALGALDSLQATGCQVGIISHVDGIAERIGAQVAVVPEGGGQSRVVARPR
jgi:DNA repair protein SbcC/Rad50